MQGFTLIPNEDRQRLRAYSPANDPGRIETKSGIVVQQESARVWAISFRLYLNAMISVLSVAAKMRARVFKGRGPFSCKI